VAKLKDSKPAQLLQQLVTEIPWGHHMLMLDKLSAPAARLWYLRATARFGWSRNVLLNQIKAGAYERAVTEKKTHNFDLALPEHFAEQADEMLIRLIVSWNFRHLVNVRREDGFNAVNLLEGWPPIRIVSPKEIIYAEPDKT
jgi:hypothetical protein